MAEEVALRFRALGELQRLRILQLLEAGPKSVSEVVGALDISQPNVSRHLQSLFDAGLIARRRSGTSRVYYVSDPLVFKLCELVCDSVVEQARAGLREVAMAGARSPARGSRR
jgi:DNA-binding transcriptional ArsR family regulator